MGARAAVVAAWVHMNRHTQAHTHIKVHTQTRSRRYRVAYFIDAVFFYFFKVPPWNFFLFFFFNEFASFRPSFSVCIYFHPYRVVLFSFCSSFSIDSLPSHLNSFTLPSLFFLLFRIAEKKITNLELT